MSLKNKVVLITGAPGGLGKAVSRAFAAQGAALALTNRSPEPLEAAFADLEDALLIGGIDVTKEEDVKRLVETVIERFGRIDVLVNIAGTWRGGTPVHEMPVDTWDFLMTLNARSVYLMNQAVAPVMLEQGAGKIVSVAAKSALEARKGNAAYSASKSAVLRITEAMSAELKHQGINVNCVLPTTIDTPANRQSMPKADFSKWVSPEALADVIVFLASDAAQAIHGAAIPVDGLV